jgi:hypothetical protein
MWLLLLPLKLRYMLLSTALAGFAALATFAWFNPARSPILAVPLAFLGFVSILGLRDLLQSRHANLRNYPITAHLRFLFEKIRPEMRQYFFEDDKDGLPFRRDKRAIVMERRAARERRRSNSWTTSACRCVTASRSCTRLLSGPACATRSG